MRLYIYDTQEARHARHDEDEGFGPIAAAGTHRLAVNGLAALHRGLAQLVREGKTFDRVLWMTHGSPGWVAFGKEGISSAVLDSASFKGQGYEKLFPKPTKMYFSGCEVAADIDTPVVAMRDAGWRFLESVGRVFLHAGGYTMGWTSKGWGWNDGLSRFFLGGHSLHFSGSVRHVTFARGGRVLERLSYNTDILGGDSIFTIAKVALRLKAAGPDAGD